MSIFFDLRKLFDLLDLSSKWGFGGLFSGRLFMKLKSEH